MLTDDPNELERVVRENLEAGVDFVKLFISDGVGTSRRPDDLLLR